MKNAYDLWIEWFDLAQNIKTNLKPAPEAKSNCGVPF